MRINYLLLIGALFAGAVSCSKDNTADENPMPVVSTDGELRVIATTDDTRAEFDATDDGAGFRVHYSSDDEMLLWNIGYTGSYYYVKSYEPTAVRIDTENSHTAEFDYSIPAPLRVGETYPGISDTYTAVYYSGILPRSAFKGIVSGQTPSNEGSGNNIFLDIPRDQTPTNTSPDPKAVLLRAYDSTAPDNGVVKTHFKHILAYMKVTIKGMEKELDKIEIDAGAVAQGLASAWIPGGTADASQTNRHYCQFNLDYAMGFSEIAQRYNCNGFDRVPGNRINIDASNLTRDDKGNYTVWVACNPIRVIYSEAQLSFRVYATDGTYMDKYVPITNEGTSGSIALKMGRAAIFTLNFGSNKTLSQPNLRVDANEYRIEGADAGKTMLTFAWTKVLNSDTFTYKIDGGAEVETSEQSATIYVDPSSEHTFAVKAGDSTGAYAESEYAEITVQAAGKIDLLAAPEVTTEAVTTSSFTAVWAPVEGATSYRYKLDDGTETETTETKVAFGNLTDGTEYTVAVQAVSTNPNYTDASSWSIATVTTVADSRPALVMNSVTATPSTTKVDLEWAAVTGATGYICKVGDNGTEYTVTDSACTIENLSASTAYVAYVKAVDETGKYKNSEWATAAFTTRAPNQPTLSWSSADFSALTFSTESESNGLHYMPGSKPDKYDSSKGFCFAGAGSNTANNLWFKADKGPGKIRLKILGSGDTSRHINVEVDGEKVGEVEVASKSTAKTGTVECPGAHAGSIIRIYSGGSNIYVQSIEWIPD